MHRNAVKLANCCALALIVVGCQSPAEKTANERAEARQEISEASKDAAEKVHEAGKDYGDKAADAQEKVTDEVREGAKEITDAQDKNADRDGAGMKLGDDDRYERFEALKNESHTAFAARADAAIATLQKDLDAARSRAGTTASKDIMENLTDADAALAEAKKDLEEVRNKTGNVIDDGRLGVSTAINKAQRELDDVYDDLSTAKM
jgi:hypothetical protein